MEFKNQGYWIFLRLEFLCCSKEHKAWAGLLNLGSILSWWCVSLDAKSCSKKLQKSYAENMPPMSHLSMFKIGRYGNLLGRP